MTPKVILSFLILFILFQFSSEQKNLTNLYELSDSTFDKQIFSSENIKNKIDWLVIFYVPTCFHCKNALKVLNEELAPYYENNTNIKFGTINNRNIENYWTLRRFNFTRVPYVLLFKNGKMYHFQKRFTFDLVKTFIEEEKKDEDSIEIPPSISIFVQWKEEYNNFLNQIAKIIQSLLDKNNIKIKWNNYMTYGLFIGSIVIIATIEIIILNKLYPVPAPKPKIAQKDANKKENNETPKKNDKKEIKDKEETKEKKVKKE